VVCTLFHENALPSLLMLAQHPKIPLHTLRGPFRCQYGTDGVATLALWSYIFFNLAAAAGTLQTEEYLEMRHQPWTLCGSDCFPSQILPHQEFIGNPRSLDAPTAPILHRDLPVLRKYLKTMFRSLYMYEVVMRECGQDVKWEEKTVYSIRRMVVGTKEDRKEDGSIRFAC